MTRVVVLSGGVGAARFLRALQTIIPASDITAIVNVGDDTELHGLHISPDLDTVTYTLADAIDPESGWGLCEESWRVMTALESYGGLTWFGLGDLDLATHLFRTQRLAEGATLTEVTAEIAHRWRVGVEILPVTDDSLRTVVTTKMGELAFQEYFVRERHEVEVTSIRFEGVPTPGPEVLDRINDAERIIIAPSNPLVSIAPLWAVPGVRDAVASRRQDVVAISPIIGGRALKGPADRLLTELGHEQSAVGVSRLYSDLAGTMVIDSVDQPLAESIADLGMHVHCLPTVMADAGVAAELARTCIG